MNLPLDIPALLKAATDIDEARNTPLAVSVYIDETAPGDVVGHVRSAFASAGAKTRVTIGYLDDNLLAEPYGADDMAVIVAGDSPRIGEQAAHIRGAGIPVMGHLGLTPQSIHKYGTYAVRAKEQAEADKLVRDAHLLEEAGCFGLVLEKIPAVLGTRVSQELEIPTIGIGAGGGTDGQVLVIHDMLGINNEFSPRFLRRYADLYTQMMTGVSRYVEDVKSGDFPSEQEQY